MADRKQSTIELRRSDRWIVGCPIYYGWIIAIAALIGSIMSSPGQTYIVSMFTERFIEDIGLSRSVVSMLYTIGTLGGAVLLQFTRMGKHIDRKGPRTMIVAISIVFGLSCIYMGFVSSAAMLAFGFIALRFLGQSSMTLIPDTMLNQWWVRYRGRVRGLMGIPLPLVTLSLLPSVTRRLISSVGWRMTYGIFGIALFLIMAPVGYLMYRRRPEDFGLQPDGGSAWFSKKEPNPKQHEINFTLRQAVRTPLFWVATLSMGAISLLSTGLIFHMESIVVDQGLAPALAAVVFAPIGMTEAIMRLPAGVLVDRVQPKAILSVALLGQAATLLMAPRLTSNVAAYVYGAALGFTGATAAACRAVIWAKYYGRLHLGSISSVALTVAIIGSALGPMVMGIARDLLGSYGAFLRLMAVFPLVFAVAGIFVHPPKLLHPGA